MSDEPRLAISEDAGLGGLQMLMTAGPARFVVDEPVALGGPGSWPVTLRTGVGQPGGMHQPNAAALCQAQGLAFGRSAGIGLSQARSASDAIRCVRAPSIEITGPLNEEQRARLLDVAGKCPVHRLLEQGARIETGVSCS